MKLGINNAKKIARLLAEIMNNADDLLVMSGAERWMVLTGFLPVAMEITQIKWNDLKEELKDLDPEEERILKETFAKELDFKSDRTEMIFEEALDIVSNFVIVIMQTIELIKKAKKKS